MNILFAKNIQLKTLKMIRHARMTVHGLVVTIWPIQITDAASFYAFDLAFPFSWPVLLAISGVRGTIGKKEALPNTESNAVQVLKLPAS